MEAIILKLVENSPLIALCITVIVVLFKKLTAAQESRIKALEDSAKKCDADRTLLHASHAKLQQNVIDTLQDLVRDK